MMDTMRENVRTKHRVTQAELFAFAMRLKETPGRWVPIPTRSKNPDQRVNRQRRGLTSALLPEDGFESRINDGVAEARWVPCAD